MTDRRGAAADVGGIISSVEELEAVYGPVVPAARTKELPRVTDHYRRFIEAAPFVAMATVGPEGVDCSPRGDPPGFVRVLDDVTLALPDRRGNNRIDSLRNIVRDPRVSLMFLIPGVDEAIRVIGRAVVSRDDALREGFAVDGKLPATVVVVTVESIFYQCPKAMVRSRLWHPDSVVDRSTLPSKGELNAAVDPSVDAREYDAAYPERLRATIY